MSLLQEGERNDTMKKFLQTIKSYNIFTVDTWLLLCMLAAFSYFCIGGFKALAHFQEMTKDIKVIHGNVPFTPYDPF